MKLCTITTILVLLPSIIFAEEFELYHIPLEVQYVVPLTRDDILKYGSHITIESKAMDKLYDELKNGSKEPANRNEIKKIRTLIINRKSKDSFFLTSDKNVIVGNNRATINHETIDSVLLEIKAAAEAGDCDID